VRDDVYRRKILILLALEGWLARLDSN
jgi:hypothetical protein